MMTVNTLGGVAYVVTCSGACTVTANVNGMQVQLAKLPASGGQASFMAVTNSVDVSDASAMVLPYQGTDAPLGMGGGVTAEQVTEMLDSALYDQSETQIRTAQGTDNYNASWFILNARHIPTGDLTAISIPCRTNSTGNITYDPVYLTLQIQSASGGDNWEPLAVSTNTVVQAINATGRWEFDNVPLDGRDVRACLNTAQSGEWNTGLTMGLRVSSRPAGDTTSNVGGAAYLADVTLTTVIYTEKFTPLEHAEDTVAHLSSDEHTALTQLIENGPGEDGASAYEIWLDAGNIGTEEDFLASLKGDPGPQGEPGTPGGQGAIVYVTGATIPSPASVATGDEIVFTVTSDFDLAEAFAALSGQMSIGWTIRNTGSSDIVIYNGNDAIARIGASSFVRGSALIDATGSGISVFKPALGQEGYINLSADGKTLTVRQPDSFAVTPFYTGTALEGNTRSWAYNISPNITHIDGGGVLIAPQGSNRLLAFMTYLKSVIGVDYSQVIDADYMFALSGMESFDVCFPRATTAFGLFNSCQKLHTVRLIIPLTADLRECFYATSAPRHVTLHAGKCTVLNFAEGFAKGDIGAIRNVENLEFEDYDGTSALASCTTFKLYAYHTKLTNQAISNCVGALPDWSLTGKSATCQFPAGRLTDDQKGILTAKGWTYTEI